LTRNKKIELHVSLQVDDNACPCNLPTTLLIVGLFVLSVKEIARAMPRPIEFLAALLGLVIFTPIILILAIGIRLTSPGPALFRQSRLGLNQKQFNIIKLRTMTVGTREVGTHLVGANAITPIGRILRKLRLDELPPFINVVRGEMSFVGPRPCLPSQFDLIAARERVHVFTIRPGITGLAQIQGVDMSTPTQLAAIDGEYVQRRSARLDFEIILKTLTGGGIDRRPAPSTAESGDP